MPTIKKEPGIAIKPDPGGRSGFDMSSIPQAPKVKHEKLKDELGGRVDMSSIPQAPPKAEGSQSFLQNVPQSRSNRRHGHRRRSYNYKPWTYINHGDWQFKVFYNRQKSDVEVIIYVGTRHLNMKSVEKEIFERLRNAHFQIEPISDYTTLSGINFPSSDGFSVHFGGNTRINMVTSTNEFKVDIDGMSTTVYIPVRPMQQQQPSLPPVLPKQEVKPNLSFSTVAETKPPVSQQLRLCNWNHVRADVSQPQQLGSLFSQPGKNEFSRADPLVASPLGEPRQGLEQPTTAPSFPQVLGREQQARLFSQPIMTVAAPQVSSSLLQAVPMLAQPAAVISLFQPIPAAFGQPATNGPVSITTSSVNDTENMVISSYGSVADNSSSANVNLQESKFEQTAKVDKDISLLQHKAAIEKQKVENTRHRRLELKQ
ncbi:hypothetical protein QBC38DRAFT_51319 [Podospora fimiseda]|uniref:Uncharacterized protein n=1 Tax=Podospora fimiseda TaxID=252190 RepID=A0AAN7GNY6_9PEZI|nr:hypothetical protein QBC38DRAFT_51319 [Podospora fimiseda]